MIKLFITISLVGITAFGGQNALARVGGQALTDAYSDVQYTVHNLSALAVLSTDEHQIFAKNTNPGIIVPYENTVKQICIFCHTPHTAFTAVPLWNKSYGSTWGTVDTSTFRLYTSSPTLSSTAKHATIGPNSESMLCLSCHDGKTSINVLHVSRINGRVAAPDRAMDLEGSITGQRNLGSYFGTVGGAYPSDIGAARGENGVITDAYAGNNLSDDHPIGFSYSEARTELGNNDSKLFDIDTAKAKGIRFYGPNRDRMECSTCHNPHVYYGYGRAGSASQKLSAESTAEQRARKPFLVRDNNGSALCISCHNK